MAVTAPANNFGPYTTVKGTPALMYPNWWITLGTPARCREQVDLQIHTARLRRLKSSWFINVLRGLIQRLWLLSIHHGTVVIALLPLGLSRHTKTSLVIRILTADGLGNEAVVPALLIVSWLLYTPCHSLLIST